MISSWVCSSSGTSSSNLLLMMNKFTLSRAVSRVVRPGIPANFSSSSALLKKKAPQSASSDASNADTSAPSALDLDGLKSQLETSRSLFAEKLKEIKAGALDQKKFQALGVQLSDSQTTPLGQLATIATRGNKLSIVAYDPNHVKHIRTAIVSSLGVPAESAGDAQTLSVNLNQNNAGKLAEQQKQTKAEFEHFKNSSSRHSLSSIRNKYMTALKKQKSGKPKDQQAKEQKLVEDTVKQYQQKLQDMLK